MCAARMASYMNVRRRSLSWEHKKPLVGDTVTIDVLEENPPTGNIIQLRQRKNELIRPAVANVDQALIIFAMTDPKPNFQLLDRFLVMMERQDIRACSA